MMKYVFALTLLLVIAFGAMLSLNVGLRFVDDMFHTQRVMVGEMVFSMPSGSVPRDGELFYPKESARRPRHGRTRCPPRPNR